MDNRFTERQGPGVWAMDNVERFGLMSSVSGKGSSNFKESTSDFVRPIADKGDRVEAYQDCSKVLKKKVDRSCGVKSRVIKLGNLNSGVSGEEESTTSFNVG